VEQMLGIALAVADLGEDEVVANLLRQIRQPLSQKPSQRMEPIEAFAYLRQQTNESVCS